MDNNIKELLSYLNFPVTDTDVKVKPTTLTLVNSTTILSLEAYGIKIITTKGTYSVRSITAYGLLWRVLNTSSSVEAHIKEKANALIRHVTGGYYTKLGILYDEDGYSLEAFNFKVTYRINTKTQTVSILTPNQWLELNVSSEMDKYFDDLYGCLIMRPLLVTKSVISIVID